MTDLPELPRVRLICPNYAMANAWAREHGIARRRLVVISTAEALDATRGVVYLCWPLNMPDPGYLRERALTDPNIEVASCSTLNGSSSSVPESSSASAS